MTLSEVIEGPLDLREARTKKLQVLLDQTKFSLREWLGWEMQSSEIKRRREKEQEGIALAVAYAAGVSFGVYL